jgi:hypothetical protein
MGNREWPWRANLSETAPREQPSWANFMRQPAGRRSTDLVRRKSAACCRAKSGETGHRGPAGRHSSRTPPGRCTDYHGTAGIAATASHLTVRTIDQFGWQLRFAHGSMVVRRPGASTITISSIPKSSVEMRTTSGLLDGVGGRVGRDTQRTPNARRAEVVNGGQGRR